MARLATCFISLVLPAVGQDLFMAPHDARPNIVWVMSDDLGWGEPGLYPSTSPHGRIATPHLDKLGKEGVQFMQAYAGYTVCAPSRTTFFTGRHSGQFVKHGFDGQELKPGQATTVASVLQKAGYATGAFGKVAPLDSPVKQGFDTFFGQIDQAECHNMYPRQIDKELGRHNVNFTGNWYEKSRELCMAHPEKYNYTIDAFHDAGMEWLSQAAKGSKPFFMYLSFTVPHAGGWTDAPANKEQGAPVPTDGQYSKFKSWPDVERDHAAVITYLDAKIGDLMDRLSSLGVDKNTLVLFASDNGAHIEGGHKKEFFNSTGGLQGNKRSLYEGGYRSPTMARWPGVIQAGRVSNFPWAFWDVMPTFAELAGTKAPEGLDGISIVPELKGEQQPDHEYLFWTWPGKKKGAVVDEPPKDSFHDKDWEDYNMEEDASAAGKGYSVRIGTFKGVVQACDPKTLKPGKNDKMEVYDLINDPFEATDIAAKHPEKVAQFKKVLSSKDLTCECYQCR